MAALLAPIGNGYTFFTAQGVVLSGGKIQTYLAGSTTPAPTYIDSTQVTQNPNPIILGSNGIAPQEIWIPSGVKYKFVVLDSNNNVLATYDNLSGINDTSGSTFEWVTTGLTPTYISTTSFSVQGDQRSVYSAGRRIRAFVTAGIVYGYISFSTFSAGVTTLTVVMDSTNLDNGLSQVDVSFLSANSQVIPNFYFRIDKGSTNQTIATGSSTIIQFNSTPVITNAITWDTVNFRAVPKYPGKWRISALMSSLVCDTAVSVVRLEIWINGSYYSRGVNNQSQVSSTGQNLGSIVNDIYAFNGTTDYVDIRVFQNSGINASLIAGTAPSLQNFTMEFIGP